MPRKRIIPARRINDLRFGQLLINALIDQNYISNEYDMKTNLMKYVVTGKDLFYMENNEIELIIDNYLRRVSSENKNNNS